jgi:hypothetical protein
MDFHSNGLIIHISEILLEVVTKPHRERILQSIVGITVWLIINAGPFILKMIE